MPSRACARKGRNGVSDQLYGREGVLGGREGTPTSANLPRSCRCPPCARSAGASSAPSGAASGDACRVAHGGKRSVIARGSPVRHARTHARARATGCAHHRVGPTSSTLHKCTCAEAGSAQVQRVTSMPARTECPRGSPPCGHVQAVCGFADQRRKPLGLLRRRRDELTRFTKILALPYYPLA